MQVPCIFTISKLQVNLTLVPAHFVLLIIKVELKQLLRVFHEIFYQVALQGCLTTDHDNYFKCFHNIMKNKGQ